MLIQVSNRLSSSHSFHFFKSLTYQIMRPSYSFRDRSNSSYGLRESLKQNYVHSRDVSNDLSIETYFKLADNMFLEAETRYRKGDIHQAYIDYQKYAKFAIEKLPYHKSYKLAKYSKHVQTLQNRIHCAMEVLEEIVMKMDEDEDMKLINSLDEVDLETTTLPSSSTDRHSLQPRTVMSSSNHTMISPSASSSTMSPSKYVEKSYNEIDLFQRLSILKPETGIPPPPKEEHPSRKNTTFTIYPVIRTNEGVNNSKNVSTSTSVSTAKSSSSFSSLLIPFNDTDRYVGTTIESLEIVNRLHKHLTKFHIPPPMPKFHELIVNQQLYKFHKDDFSIKFDPFLPNDLTHSQYYSAPIQETNRCFFIHLGISMSLHPFCLQVVFRHLVHLYHIYLKEKKILDETIFDILTTVTRPADCVDANCLCFLWPEEFNETRICIISSDDKSPMFSTFYKKGSEVDSLRDVIIHCDGEHFTLLRPYTVNSSSNAFTILPTLLHEARNGNCIVLEYEIDPLLYFTTQPSITRIIQNMVMT